MLFSYKQQKTKSQNHPSNLALTVPVFFYILCTEKLVERRAAFEVAGKSFLAWKKESMGEKEPKKIFLHFELQLYKVSEGTWKH